MGAAAMGVGSPIGLNVRSEFGALEVALVHEPGLEIERLTSANRSHYLFEDIPYLPRMQDEHRALVEVLESRGVRVLRLRELLGDILHDEAVRRRLVSHACSVNLQPSLASILLDTCDRDEIGDVLFFGLTAREFEDRTGRRIGPTKDCEDPFLVNPAPNAYFTRDPAAVVMESVVSCKMHYVPRVQESVVMREVFRAHPYFAGAHFLFGDQGTEDRPFTIEGGDITILNSKAIAIGRSERTRSETVRLLARKLFEQGVAQRVYQIDIPARREYMHLDTVFTIVGPGVVVAYPGVMEQVTRVIRYEPRVYPSEKGDVVVASSVDENRHFNVILEEEFGRTLEVIPTGGGSPHYAEREQWSDGTNVLAIGPGVVLSYDRNVRTNHALEAAGIEVIRLEGAELVRGLGGPRCMTMPLRRGAVQEAN